MAVDGGSEGLGEKVEDFAVSSFGELVDCADVRVGEWSLCDTAAGFGREKDDVVGDDEGPGRLVRARTSIVE